MYDGLRTMGWYSRADYARYRAEERANELLRTHADAGGGRARRAPGGEQPPASDARAEALAAAAELLASVATVHITSLAAAATVADESLPAPDASVDTHRLSGRRARGDHGACPRRSGG